MEALRNLVDAFKNAKPSAKVGVVAVFATLLTAAVLWAGIIGSALGSGADEDQSRITTYNEFMALVEDGAIASAELLPDRVIAKSKDEGTVLFYHDRWLYTGSFLESLVDAGVEVTFPDRDDTLSGWIQEVINWVIKGAILLVFILVGLYLLRMMRGPDGGMSWPPVSRDQSVRFADVAGQTESKFELEEIRQFLSDPSAFEITGAKPPRGVLMAGPPGTGKTMLARALAGEAGVSFIAVNGSDFSAMFVGVGRDRVQQLFRKARKNAPCIVFIDEIDSVARKRGGGGSDVSREQDTTLNQLLVEMNGFKPSDGIVVIAATNRIDVLDPAILRPGRFDRHIHIGTSDMSGRTQILGVHCKGKPLADDVDLSVIARGTPGFSGADIENLVNEAAVLAARRKSRVISAADFEEARDKVLMGLQRKSLVLDDEECRLIAVHEAGHAVVACLRPDSDPVHHATIIPRGRSLGLVMRLPTADRVSVTRSKLLADLDVLMAGRAAEEILLGQDKVTTGASSDIEEATRIARSMVSEWGMCEEIGMVRIPAPNGALPERVEEEVRRLIHEAYDRAKRTLEQNLDRLQDLSTALLERKMLDGDEVRAIVLAAKAAA